MNVDDIKLRTMANMNCKVNNIKIVPITLRNIVSIGYDTYIKYLNALCVSKEQLIHPDFLDQVPDDVNVFDIIFELYKNDEFIKIYKESLILFFQVNDIYYDNGLYLNGEVISSTDYEEMIRVIKIQNMFKEKKDDEFNPKNDRVRKLKEKILKNREKVSKLKKESEMDNGLSFLDLVSVLSSNANGINIFNVFELNIFQFNDQFNRMKLLNDYEINIQSLLHGADPKNIELKHWMSSLNT